MREELGRHVGSREREWRAKGLGALWVVGEDQGGVEWRYQAAPGGSGGEVGGCGVVG